MFTYVQVSFYDKTYKENKDHNKSYACDLYDNNEYFTDRPPNKELVVARIELTLRLNQ